MMLVKLGDSLQYMPVCWANDNFKKANENWYYCKHCVARSKRKASSAVKVRRKRKLQIKKMKKINNLMELL